MLTADLAGPLCTSRRTGPSQATTLAIQCLPSLRCFRRRGWLRWSTTTVASTPSSALQRSRARNNILLTTHVWRTRSVIHVDLNTWVICFVRPREAYKVAALVGARSCDPDLCAFHVELSTCIPVSRFSQRRVQLAYLLASGLHEEQ